MQAPDKLESKRNPHEPNKTDHCHFRHPSPQQLRFRPDPAGYADSGLAVPGDGAHSPSGLNNHADGNGNGNLFS